jgi:polyisoprenyl-teichoic acid--peptidoglycan teichoic acid transferase
VRARDDHSCAGPLRGRRASDTVSHTTDKPYTKYHASRVRRARTEPPIEAPADTPRRVRGGGAGGAGGDRQAAGVGARGAGSRGRSGVAASAAAQAEPVSIYRADRRARTDARPDLAAVPRAAQARRRFHWWYLLAIPLALAIAGGVWAYFGYSAFNKAVHQSNTYIHPKARAALVDPQAGVLSGPTTVLVLGSDQRGHQPARSDSILLMRFNPHTHTVSQLSIPRDTLVNVPGHGQTKINEAYFWGGTPLAIKVVSGFTGVPINHVMLVNFHGFPAMIDSVGGVVVNVPHDISSLYIGGRTVHFKKGPQLMNGKRALIYSRIRHSDNDFMRMGRQQQVIQALETKISRPRNALHLPWTGASFMRHVATDLSTNQILGLAYIDWRAKGDRQYKSVLLGTPEMIGYGSYVVVDHSTLRRDVRQFLSH